MRDAVEHSAATGSGGLKFHGEVSKAAWSPRSRKKGVY